MRRRDLLRAAGAGGASLLLSGCAGGETPYGGLREPLHLSEGWREYTFEWTTPELPAEPLYVALGTSVVWETEATHFVDDVSVDLEPA